MNWLSLASKWLCDSAPSADGGARGEGEFMRVIVDFDRCDSNALCMAEAPEVFEVREDDNLYVLRDQPSEDLRDKVVAAVRACPKSAISIED
jgi:ferredoxin